MAFGRKQFFPCLAPPIRTSSDYAVNSQSAKSLRRVTPGLEWLDARHRAVRDVSDSRRVPSGMVRDLLLAANGEDVSASPYWLCRLVRRKFVHNISISAKCPGDRSRFLGTPGSAIEKDGAYLLTATPNPTKSYRSIQVPDDPLSISIPFVRLGPARFHQLTGLGAWYHLDSSGTLGVCMEGSWERSMRIDAAGIASVMRIPTQVLFRSQGASIVFACALRTNSSPTLMRETSN